MWNRCKSQLKTLFVYCPRIALALSGGNFLLSLKNTLELMYFTVSRKVGLVNKPYDWNILYQGKSLSITLERPMDLASLYEIFVDEEYSLQLDGVQNILDLGAHWGDSALYFAMKYPTANVFAVEPEPAAFKRLKALAEKLPNIVPMQFALAEVAGSIDFFVSTNSLGNGLSQRSNRDEKIIVEALSLEDVRRRCGVQKFDLLKFDIEGGESMIFSQPENAKLAQAFVGELHYDLAAISNERVRDFFSGFHFTEQPINKHRSIITVLPLSSDISQ